MYAEVHTYDCCDFQCLYSMHSMGPAVIAVKCLQQNRCNRWLILGHTEKALSADGCHAAAKREMRCTSYRQTQEGEKPISSQMLLGVGPRRVPKSYKHDRLAIAVSRYCSFVMIKSQQQNQHRLCVVM